MPGKNDSWGANSYMDILKMDPLVFIAYLEQFKIDVDCHIETMEEAQRAGGQLGMIANSYSFLTTLYAYAGILKRQLSRNGKNTEYQDMIDKETALSLTMKAVDLTYRSLSKAISVYSDSLRELFYTDGLAGPKNSK